MKRSSRYTILWLIILAEGCLLKYLDAVVSEPLPWAGKAVGTLVVICPFLLLLYTASNDSDAKPAIRKVCGLLYRFCILCYVLAVVVTVFFPQ